MIDVQLVVFLIAFVVLELISRWSYIHPVIYCWFCKLQRQRRP